MTQNPYEGFLYPLTNAIFDDLIDWLKDNTRFLNIIGKWCNNIPGERVRDYVDDIFPIVYIDETSNNVFSEFYNGELWDEKTKQAGPKTTELTYIILNRKRVVSFENYLKLFNNKNYGNNINIKLFQQEQLDLNIEVIFQTMCEFGFEIAFVLIHEFIHYVGWQRNVYPYSKPYAERMVCSTVESSDDYRVELCQRELFNYTHPYYSHPYFEGKSGFIVTPINILLKQSGIFYEWKICFKRFRFKIFNKVQQLCRQTINIWDERIDFRNTR